MTYHSVFSAGEDYVGLTDYLLTFDSSNAVNNVPLEVLDDNVGGNTEIFLAYLSFPGSSSKRIILEPNTTVIEINDNDGELPAMQS